MMPYYYNFPQMGNNPEQQPGNNMQMYPGMPVFYVPVSFFITPEL